MGSYVPPSSSSLVDMPIHLNQDPVNTHPLPNHASDQPRYQADQYDNPYLLLSNDHAGLVLVSDRLTTASDVHSWRRSFGWH